MSNNYYLYIRYRTGYGVIVKQAAHIGRSGRSFNIIQLSEAFAEYLGTIVEWLAKEGDSRLEECKRLLHRWNTFCHTQDDGAFYYVQHPDAINDIDDEGWFTVSYDIEERYTERDYVDGSFQKVLDATSEWILSKDDFFVEDECHQSYDLREVFDLHQQKDQHGNLRYQYMDGYSFSKHYDSS